MQHGTRERGLAGAEVAVRIDGQAGRDRMRERGAECKSAGFFMQMSVEVAGHIVVSGKASRGRHHCSSASQTGKVPIDSRVPAEIRKAVSGPLPPMRTAST